MVALSPKSSHKQSSSLIEQAEYHEETGEIQIADADWVLIRTSTFRDLVKATERMLGSGATVIWLEAGKHAGKEFAEILLREGTEPEEVPLRLEMFFTQGDWGRIQTKVNFTRKEAVVRIDNCATARQTVSKEPVCHFIRGFISGVSDVMFDALAECVETACMAKGDTFCEFRIKRKPLS